MPSLLLHARLVDPESARIEPGILWLEAGRIRARLGPGESRPEGVPERDLGERLLAPGFLDLHHHGAAIFAGPGELASAIRHDAQEQLRHGATSFLVTSVVLDGPALGDFVTETVRALEGRLLAPPADPATGGARVLGLHLEGPWISPQAPGAQPTAGIRPYAVSEGREILARGEGWIRMVTLAPEVAGAERLQADLARVGVVGALGHSRASWNDADRVIGAGASHVTHLYNAMSGVHHRAPGLAACALGDPRLSVDLICDGVHVAPEMVALSARILGDRLVLITDRIEPPPGGDFGAGAVAERDGALRLADGRLAGSCLGLAGAVANARRFAGLGLVEAVAACTLRPARLLGLESDCGTLRPGARADFAVLDDAGRLRETWLAGEPAWTAAD